MHNGTKGGGKGNFTLIMFHGLTHTYFTSLDKLTRLIATQIPQMRHNYLFQIFCSSPYLCAWCNDIITNVNMMCINCWLKTVVCHGSGAA